MVLDSTQKHTLRLYVESVPALAALLTAGNLSGLATELNKDHSPDYFVFKSMMTLNQISIQFDGVEWGNLTTGNVTKLNSIATWSPLGINPALSDRRAMFADIFSSAPTTLARLGNTGTAWRRLARVIEKIFATGVGTTVAPSILVVEGTISSTDLVGLSQA